MFDFREPKQSFWSKLTFSARGDELYSFLFFYSSKTESTGTSHETTRAE